MVVAWEGSEAGEFIPFRMLIGALCFVVGGGWMAVYCSCSCLCTLLYTRKPFSCSVILVMPGGENGACCSSSCHHLKPPTLAISLPPSIISSQRSTNFLSRSHHHLPIDRMISALCKFILPIPTKRRRHIPSSTLRSLVIWTSHWRVVWTFPVVFYQPPPLLPYVLPGPGHRPLQQLLLAKHQIFAMSWKLDELDLNTSICSWFDPCCDSGCCRANLDRSPWGCPGIRGHI